MDITKEITFEDAIEKYLTEHGGYRKSNPEEFDRNLALNKNSVLAFLQESQPKEWERLQKTHGNQIETKVIQRLHKELELRGMLDVLRNGFTDYGVKFHMAYFKTETSLNPETIRLYNLNRLEITRQVKFSPKNEKSLDMVICINGLPVATFELKNQFTRQDVNFAKRQYMQDRDPRELLFQFKKRALVHFAVDADDVYMTTKLDGANTKFLPFNLGYNNGAGNPPNPHGYKTSYLWEAILPKDSFMEILAKFLHLQVEVFYIEGKKVTKETMIFPRYHQLDVVRKLVSDAKLNGVGKNYLIEHSAGSGKSNSIAWLAYRLGSLHNANDDKVYDSIIVVTDRNVLDQQLQDTIYQFEHKFGVVQKIDKDSTQLAKALEAGTGIIITTLQKFPFVVGKISNLPNRKYAIIVDEAHSSQGGEASRKMKEVLSVKSLEEAEKEESETQAEDTDVEDEIRHVLLSRGRQTNLSFFGFTATPKPKTLEVFGEKGIDGKPRPFHLYSMRQAIEEGFILDVLEHYTTYKTYFKLSKAIEDDPELNKKKASIAIARYISLHPTNLAQKSEVMIEHFRSVTAKKIGGKAKAMVVTSSRLHALKYYQEFKKYIKQKGYKDIGVLVAFSGTVEDKETGEGYRESKLNGFGEKELPDEFKTNEYQVLIVADKYQTGFDEPLLHTMYVDKKLSGIKAVQTLSRLNRKIPGKEDTFILDFVNETDTILESFQPYYEMTLLTETTDPNLLYDLKLRLEGKKIFSQEEINEFCNIFFKSANLQSPKDQALLYAIVQQAVDRLTALGSQEEKDDFKHTLTSYIRLYSFLSQIVPFQDPELEKLYAYGRLLQNKLPKDVNTKYTLTDDIALEYYRLQKISEGSIKLEKQGGVELSPTTEAGLSRDKEEKAHLSEIIRILNDRFGTDFTEADRLFFDQIEAELVADEKLSDKAKSNTIENFRFGFDEVFETKLIDRMDQNREIFAKIMDDEQFAETVKTLLMKQVYKKLNEMKVSR
jgi:type I restriction enzyme, R subunit